jgi:quercetin dioxygenase-like cupin family protein
VYVTSVNDVEEIEMNVKGARGVKVKYLLDENVGASRLQLRLFTLDVKGYTPLEKHKHEHEVFILHGKASVHGGENEIVVTAGDAIFIPSWEEHQFKNIGDEELQFLCTKETVH